MYIEQLYTNCLSQASYYIESQGVAAIVDPLRDIGDYLRKAKERGAQIRYIFETHFHADFVSGHLDLAKATGAMIVFGPGAKTGFDSLEATDGQRFKLGSVEFEVLHTPGHTLESSCYLLYNEQAQPHALFSGDTLFVGDVGRPDLLDGILSKEELASMMYDSLNNRIKTLPDTVILYPAHGPGSACGKSLGPETYSTIGIQKNSNYALQEMSREDFIREVTEGIPVAPAYFFEDARLNKNGYIAADELLSKSLRPLDPQEFRAQMQESVTIVDTRNPEQFEQGFIPGSLNFGLNGQFAIWAANLLPLSTAILIIADPGKEQESIIRLSRVGFANFKGFLDGGFTSWKEAGLPLDLVISVDPEEFALDYKHSDIRILDVRKPGEYADAHVKGALSFSLQDLPGRLNELDSKETYYVHCAGGYRSMIASSYLKSKGVHSVKNVYGGFGKIKSTDVQIEAAAKLVKA